MIVAIGGKIRYDNRHFYENWSQPWSVYDYDLSNSTQQSIHISGYTCGTWSLPHWLLMWHWYRLPYWASPELGSRMKETTRKTQFSCKRRSWLKLKSYMNISDMYEESPYQKTSFSVLMVVLCMMYAAMHLAFMVCAAISYSWWDWKQPTKWREMDYILYCCRCYCCLQSLSFLWLFFGQVLLLLRQWYY